MIGDLTNEPCLVQIPAVLRRCRTTRRRGGWLDQRTAPGQELRAILLLRHDLHGACFGSDESADAQMIAAAAAGDRDDGLAFVLTLLPPAAADEAVQTAEVLGLAIHKPVIALTATPPRFPESLR